VPPAAVHSNGVLPREHFSGYSPHSRARASAQRAAGTAMIFRRRRGRWIATEKDDGIPLSHINKSHICIKHRDGLSEAGIFVEIATCIASSLRACAMLDQCNTPICAPTNGGTPLGLRFLRRFRFARTVEGKRSSNERLEGGLVNFFSFMDVDRAAYISVETRVEETSRVLHRRTLGEGKLHDTLVG
jgi:hypothetical protein